MVIFRSLFGNKSAPFVAVRTLADFGIVLAFFEMTDETGAVRDRNVLSLDDLGMAACAAEPFASLQVSEMNGVVKHDFVETDLPLQKSFIMTPFAKTTFIRNFSPGL
jgi:hypothetical protein